MFRWLQSWWRKLRHRSGAAMWVPVCRDLSCGQCLRCTIVALQQTLEKHELQQQIKCTLCRKQYQLNLSKENVWHCQICGKFVSAERYVFHVSMCIDCILDGGLATGLVEAAQKVVSTPCAVRTLLPAILHVTVDRSADLVSALIRGSHWEERKDG